MFNIDLRHLEFLVQERSERKDFNPLFKSNTEHLATAVPPIQNIPSEFNVRGYLSYLLSIDAMLEHSLMVQYLYTAYSMDNSFLPEAVNTQEKTEVYRKQLFKWKELILGVAKEEMGHFISVQNLLRFLGSALNFGRQDFPWNSQLHPFPFELEPFSFKAIAKYVYAESPEGWYENKNGEVDKADAAAHALITKILEKEKTEMGVPVGVIFEKALEILKDDAYAEELTFHADTYPCQAKFDEWGRGYKDGERGRSKMTDADAEKFDRRTPDVLVEPLQTRYDAIAALEEIAEQGEATQDLDETPSHFRRFLEVFKEMMVYGEDTRFTKPVVTNPYIATNSEEDLKKENAITHPVTKLWANLSNVRYKLLLAFLTHSFLLDDGVNQSRKSTPRGLIINATFGEMYNIRTLATLLTDAPVKAKPEKSELKAGAPFTMPYNLDLPMDENSRWNAHKDDIEASIKITNDLLHVLEHSSTAEVQTHKKYLYGLREADTKFLDTIAKLTQA